ncbi:MAG: ArsC family reductase [Gammaproteobacteria bacterium]
MHILYGIKNCDTVKKARLWLEQQGIAYRFHDFRIDGLERMLLERFEAELGWEAMLNRRSTTWRQLPTEQQNGLSRDKALHLMQANPALIKRPILQCKEKFIIGFKPEIYQTEL